MMTVIIISALSILAGAAAAKVVRTRRRPQLSSSKTESRLSTVATATRLLTEKDANPPEMDPIAIPAPLPLQRTAKNGEALTDAEIQFLVALHKAGLPDCIDCQIGFLLGGPSGGFSTNYRCSNKMCFSMFNIGLPFAERISDASPNANPLKMVEQGPFR